MDRADAEQIAIWRSLLPKRHRVGADACPRWTERMPSKSRSGDRSYPKNTGWERTPVRDGPSGCRANRDLAIAPTQKTPGGSGRLSAMDRADAEQIAIWRSLLHTYACPRWTERMPSKSRSGDRSYQKTPVVGADACPRWTERMPSKSRSGDRSYPENTGWERTPVRDGPSGCRANRDLAIAPATYS